jgi:aldose 1-epimerase
VAEIFTLRSALGVEARIMGYGARLMSLSVPDRAGRLANVILGFEAPESYRANTAYLGATIGRYANRIANGRFTLDGESYQLARNNGHNSLHGGNRGFDKRAWSVEGSNAPDSRSVTLRYVSRSGEEGYPGELRACVSYSLTDQNVLIVAYHATATAPTPVNLTNHAYFNLGGDFGRDILGHVITIHADSFTPVDARLIPTGDLQSVAGTALDFRTPQLIGARICADDAQLRMAGGYDHNWVLRPACAGASMPAATLMDPVSGRVLTVSTTQPGLQFYTGNFLDGGPDTGFAHRTGLCLETQHFPDSPNQPYFPVTILRPGQTYSHRTQFAFGVVGCDGHAVDGH